MKVIVGMSGGIDSSMTAYLLKRQGYEVEGLSLTLFETRGRRDPKSCCSLEAIEDARRTADFIGIPHRAIDARDRFIDSVITPFIDSYKNGLTPNPCILCNRHIKFPILLEEADRTGADFIATGHYARVEDGFLKKGIDDKKDQSYVLYALSKTLLKRLLLPLGVYKKDDIRIMAREIGLPVFNRPESQEICFVEGRDYTPIIETISADSIKEGDIVNTEGKVLGRHNGVHRFTIGQRKGLGVNSLVPLYVVRIDPKTNTVYVGDKEDAMRRGLRVEGLNMFLDKGDVFRSDVKIRSMMRPRPAMVYIKDGGAIVEFDEPEFAPAPGQAAVFYDGDVVIGGGTIG